MSNGEDTSGEANEELRIALVMNGGVSLAVWMGGVTMEVNRVVLHDPYRPEADGDDRLDPVARNVYGALLRLFHTRPRVDVIAGASAGGLNGALLGTALVHDRDLSPLATLWLQKADMGRMLRSPTKNDPPSLMEGDTYFLPRLQEAFAMLATGRRRPVEEVPLRLIMTTTLITGRVRQFVDELGTSLPDEVHRGQFHFFRGPGVEDDFARPDLVNRLALAGRSTASFPAAFEASFIPVGAPVADPDFERPDMRGTADFDVDRYVMDGGVLVNKPIRPVIRAMFAQPAAEQPVRRVLAYVVPDPGTFPPNTPDDRDQDIPSLRHVITHVVTLPRVESVSSDLEDIDEHNRAARTQKDVREALLIAAETTTDLHGLAATLFATYRKLRASEAVDGVIAAITPDAALIAGLGEAVWRALRDAVTAGTTPWLPVGHDRDPSPAGWPWGAGGVEHAGITVLDLVKRGLAIAWERLPAGDPSTVALADLRSQLHEVLGRVRRAREAERAYWRSEAAALVERGWGEVGDADALALVSEWLSSRPAITAGADPSLDADRLAGEVADVLIAATPILVSVGQAAGGVAPDGSPVAMAATPVASDGPLVGDGPPRGAAGALLAMIGGLEGTRAAGLSARAAAPVGSDRERAMARLADLGIVQYTLAAGIPVVEQTAQFVVMSANTPNSLDGRDTVNGKVAGIQIAHFGAFYKRSWRANDWMWGRIDGAQRLVQILLHPAGLRSVATEGALSGEDPVESCLRRIEAIAIPGPADADADAAEVLRPYWQAERDAARDELAFLRDPAATPPPYLQACSRAIARRLQVDLLRTALPDVARSVRHDQREGAFVSSETQDFLDAVDGQGTGDRLSAAAARDIFPQCLIGREKITDEIGSDLFTGTVSKAAAVGVSALQGQRSGLGMLRPILSTVRQVVLLLYVMARAAISKQRTGFAVLMFLLATGGALIGLDVVTDGFPSYLLWIGVGLVAAALVLAGLRAGLVLVVLNLLVWVGIPVGLYIALQHLLQDHPSLNWVAPSVLVAGLVIGAMLLGSLKEGERTARWRRKMRRRPKER